jgi:hypothetical protein
MKDRAQIEERLRRLVQGALDARMADVAVRLPHKCQFNHRQPLDHRRRIYDEPNPHYNRISKSPGSKEAVEQTLGLCLYNQRAPDEWEGRICEDPSDALSCPYKYIPKRGIADVYEDFCQGLAQSDWRKEHTPEIESLLWVLGSGLRIKPSLAVSSYPSFWERLVLLFSPMTKRPRPPEPSLEEGGSADIQVYLPALDDYAENGARKITNP